MSYMSFFSIIILLIIKMFKFLFNYINKNLFLLLLIVILISLLLYCNNIVLFENFTDDSKNIEYLTDQWFDNIVKNKDSNKVYSSFCSNSSFIGNVTSIKKNGEDIKNYFDSFVKLPGLKIISKNYNIVKISQEVYTNTIYATWKWDDLEEPLFTKIILTFNNKCIYQLHSNALPSLT